MSERLALPPIYQAHLLSNDVDPFRHAIAEAEQGVDAGALYWHDDEQRFRAAIVLAPVNPMEESLPVMLIGLLGLYDALGSLIPPVVAVTFNWPDGLNINGAMVGGVRMIIGETPNPTAVPDWLVIGFELQNKNDDGDRPDGSTTSLEAEGCHLVMHDLLESYARHFLSWINRWQADGIGPIRQAWISRSPDIGNVIELKVNGQTRRGVFKGLNDTGAIELSDEGRRQVIPLDLVVKRPSWLEGRQ